MKVIEILAIGILVLFGLQIMGSPVAQGFGNTVGAIGGFGASVGTGIEAFTGTLPTPAPWNGGNNISGGDNTIPNFTGGGFIG